MQQIRQTVNSVSEWRSFLRTFAGPMFVSELGTDETIQIRRQHAMAAVDVTLSTPCPPSGTILNSYQARFLMDTYTRADLIDRLASDDPEIRANAMRRLQIGSDDELVLILAGCLLEHHTPVPAAARRVLTALGDDTVIFLLIDRLADERAGWSVARAISEFDDNRPAVRYIQDLVRRSGDAHADYGPRLRAARHLGISEISVRPPS